MLTSHKCLLGGFVAVSCVTGILTHRIAASEQTTPLSVQPPATEAIDISDDNRGSGRISNQPVRNHENKERSPLAHRGSGRVRPNTI